MRKRAKRVLRVIIISILAIQVFAILWATFAYSQNDFIKKWRNIWIETAMSTASHHWLATSFLPEDVIAEAVSERVGATALTDEVEEEIGSHEMSMTWFEKLQRIPVGKEDPAGNEIVINDREQEVVIVKVHTDMYDGKMAIIGDPSRVYVGTCGVGKSRGWNMTEYMSKEDAIIGINASGFFDANGVGTGSNVVGRSRTKGEDWGNYLSDYNTIGFDTDNRLRVGLQSDWDARNIRDGVQFNPALIINGKQNVEGTAGWGLQPRTAIAQRADGTVFLLVIDGRQPGHSIGATMEDLVNEFKKYNVLNAAAVDGGSSSIMGYDGKLITKCSSPQDGGRYLPNAFLVTKLQSDEIEE